ncbi:hypothetical protein XFF6990_430085 [Xanthomonas citri pv. fuscans]|nr:hypothetical protein XFF6990_430085 [Xanthomonas citri pv. fuscans]
MPVHRPMPASHRARQHASARRLHRHVAALRAAQHRMQIRAIGKNSNRLGSSDRIGSIVTTVRRKRLSWRCTNAASGAQSRRMTCAEHVSGNNAPDVLPSGEFAENSIFNG